MKHQVQIQNRLAKPAQQSVHPTLGILARFQAFFYASAFSQSDSVPPPAPARVTQTVGQFLAKQRKQVFMDSSSFNIKKKMLCLIIRTIGGLFVLFGISTFISLVMRPPDITFSKISFIFILVIIGIASIIAGYKLIRVDETGRNFSSLLILAILPFMIVSSSTSLTNEKSKFAYKIWTFQGEYFSPNASAYDFMFDKLLLVLVALGVLLILFLSSQAVKNVCNNHAKSS